MSDVATNIGENDTKDFIVTEFVEPKPYIKDIGTGKQIATFSHGSDVMGPKLQSVTLDPIDPEIGGGNQMIIATIKHDSDVTLARVTVFTDNTEISEVLELTEGTLRDGTWEVEVPYNDTYLETYYVKFFLESDSGNFEGGLKLR